jgi:hypothetical protein
MHKKKEREEEKNMKKRNRRRRRRRRAASRWKKYTKARATQCNRMLQYSIVS